MAKKTQDIDPQAIIQEIKDSDSFYKYQKAMQIKKIGTAKDFYDFGGNRIQRNFIQDINEGKGFIYLKWAQKNPDPIKMHIPLHDFDSIVPVANIINDIESISPNIESLKYAPPLLGNLDIQQEGQLRKLQEVPITITLKDGISTEDIFNTIKTIDETLKKFEGTLNLSLNKCAQSDSPISQYLSITIDQDHNKQYIPSVKPDGQLDVEGVNKRQQLIENSTTIKELRNKIAQHNKKQKKSKLFMFKQKDKGKENISPKKPIEWKKPSSVEKKTQSEQKFEIGQRQKKPK